MFVPATRKSGYLLGMRPETSDLCCLWHEQFNGKQKSEVRLRKLFRKERKY